VKPAAFAYVRAASLDQAFDLLAAHGDEARLLAGGQSLIATLNLRLSTPAMLIDINGLTELSGISIENGALRIGALTRQRAVEDSAAVADHAPLLKRAIPHIAHPAIRNRGTVGGSLAYADPAAELPACALALGAEIELEGSGGQRRIAATDFFLGLYETALGPAELVSALIVPKAGPEERSAFAELARRHGDYALAGLAARARVANDALSEVRLVFFGVGTKPVIAPGAGAALEGRRPDPAAIEAAQAALADDLDPTGDLHASAAMKMQLARVLTGRVVRELAGAAS
jgi:aerobic carbon-monoxide dehydrogenase medium subunit